MAWRTYQHIALLLLLASQTRAWRITHPHMPPHGSSVRGVRMTTCSPFARSIGSAEARKDFSFFCSKPKQRQSCLQLGAGPVGLEALGTDALVYLTAVVAVVPVCRRLNISPILGFLGAGLALGPSGLKLIKDLQDLNALGEVGIVFLLFEQGLELSLARLRALSKYVFGLGILQVGLSTLAFTIFPFVGGVQLLEAVFRSPAALVDITRLDEAFVVGAALSLSSSAFVLKILQEKGQLGERFGQATLGVLLFQDIAVVPLLVLLPIVETARMSGMSDINAQLLLVAGTIGKGLLGIGAILLLGRTLLRRVFELVAGARSGETFVALCLLVAVGLGEATDALGLSTTLGAFAAGTLLAETNYRTQIEADIAPFRGLLIGLFFMTTGASADLALLLDRWPTVLALLLGLVSFKTVLTFLSGLFSGLSPGDSARVATVLSGGGEFAFVVLTLAQRLSVLPPELNKLLVGVVVLSLALTPPLAALGDAAGKYLDEKFDDRAWGRPVDASGGAGAAAAAQGYEEKPVVVICGFGPVGQVASSLLRAPFVADDRLEYVSFDLDPRRVTAARAQGYPAFYGDGSQPEVLRIAGIKEPRAIVVTYTNNEAALNAVKRLRSAFPTVPIFARAPDYELYWRLKDAGATAVIADISEIGLRLGSALLEEVGAGRRDEIAAARIALRRTLADLARAGNVRTEFARSFAPGMVAPPRMAAATTATSAAAAAPALASAAAPALDKRVEVVPIGVPNGAPAAAAAAAGTATAAGAAVAAATVTSTSVSTVVAEMTPEVAKAALRATPFSEEDLGVVVCLLPEAEPAADGTQSSTDAAVAAAMAAVAGGGAGAAAAPVGDNLSKLMSTPPPPAVPATAAVAAATAAAAAARGEGSSGTAVAVAMGPAAADGAAAAARGGGSG